MSPRTGRPPSDHVRQKKVETRMSKEELAKLDYCCKHTGLSRSGLIRTGIDAIYADLRKPKEN